MPLMFIPAAVCLAIPLYEQVEMLKGNWKAIVLGNCAGVVTSLVSVLAFCVLFGLGHGEYVTLLPKSITTAIGSTSHAIGTAKAMEMGELEGAMGSLPIAVAGLLTVVGVSMSVPSL